MAGRRIGIYAGTFDPVHSGHIAFALQALRAVNLDKIYFLPERRPRDKQQVEHFGHRVAMLKQALKPYPEFSMLELVEVSFSVERTLPKLRQKFKDSQLVFLFGSDVAIGLAAWPNVKQLLASAELVIGLRNQDDRHSLHTVIEDWPIAPEAVSILNSFAPDVSSGNVRDALRKRQSAAGLLTSVERYSDHHWLYISLSDLKQ